MCLIWVFEWKVRTHWTRTKTTQGKSKFKSNALHFLCCIVGLFTNNAPNRPNIQFCIQLRRFTATQWRYENSLRTFATEDMTVPSRQRTVSQKGHFDQKQHYCPPPPTLPAWLGPLGLLGVPPLWHDWDDWGRIAGSAEHPHSARLPARITSGRSAGNAAHVRKAATSRIMVGNRSKVSFWLDGSTSPENYEY
jgi:hypothetical protein